MTSTRRQHPRDKGLTTNRQELGNKQLVELARETGSTVPENRVDRWSRVTHPSEADPWGNVVGSRASSDASGTPGSVYLGGGRNGDTALYQLGVNELGEFLERLSSAQEPPVDEEARRYVHP